MNVDRKGKGNIVIGVMLVLTGVAIMLDRTGVLHLRDQWTLWPLILGGIGLARFLQSVPGEPKQGLLFLTAAAWLLLAEAGVGVAGGFVADRHHRPSASSSRSTAVHGGGGGTLRGRLGVPGGAAALQRAAPA